MNLKNKIATNISLLFSIFLGVILFSIYLLFAKFRKDEFKDILKDRLFTTSNFVMINHSDQVTDLNKLNNTPTYSLQQEQILVFNRDLELIYSNIKDKEFDWNKNDLYELKVKGQIYRKEKDTEIYGEKIHENYYLIQATDTMGKNKLEYLRNLIIASFIFASISVWLFSFRFAGRMISPLDDFQKRITNISVNNLNEKLPETNRKDEINLLAKVFNTMMERINHSYSAQKEFTASASHEIKTPLTRMSFQLENLSNISQDEDSKKYIFGIKNEVFQLSDTVDSLLILSKIEENQNPYFEEVRMDEVIFNAFEKVKKSFPEFEMDFDIAEQSEDGTLTIKGIKSLLEIVFINIFKNANLYSSDRKATVEIFEGQDKMSIKVSNSGEVIPEEERHKIFEAFRRGSNSQNIQGSGLGLRISKRILDYHSATITYNFLKERNNQFLISFPKI